MESRSPVLMLRFELLCKNSLKEPVFPFASGPIPCHSPDPKVSTCLFQGELTAWGKWIPTWRSPHAPPLTLGLSTWALGEDLLGGDPGELEAGLEWHPLPRRVGLPGVKPHLHSENSAHMHGRPGPSKGPAPLSGPDGGPDGASSSQGHPAVLAEVPGSAGRTEIAIEHG